MQTAREIAAAACASETLSGGRTHHRKIDLSDVLEHAQRDLQEQPAHAVQIVHPVWHAEKRSHGRLCDLCQEAPLLGA